jgi:hypothetical protein
MAMGKHNFHVRAGAELMARKLGNALVAPVTRLLRGGAVDVSLRRVFRHVVESIASASQLASKTCCRSRQWRHQAPLRNVADRLNQNGRSGAAAFALTAKGMNIRMHVGSSG